MRIILIYLGRRGAGGKISYELAHRLCHQHVLQVALSKYAEILSTWQEASIQCFAVNTFHNPLQALGTLVIPMRINNLIQQIKAFEPDVLLFPMFHPWNAIIQKKLSAIPSVVFVHDPHPHPDWSGWLYGKLENSSIHQAARCVVMSETLKPALIQRGIKDEHIDVIPLGPLLYAPSPILNKKQELPRLLFFGRIAPYKGLKTLLEAYEQVVKTIPCRLRIVGDGNLTAYKGWIARNPDIEIVNRWIAEDEIGDFFAQSDLVVLPYTSASQSGVIPIAAAYGLPVIATRTGGLPEQIEDGMSGWLVSPGDISALAQAIHLALTQPDLARQRGLALKERFEKLFNWEQSAQQVQISLKKAIQSDTRDE